MNNFFNSEPRNTQTFPRANSHYPQENGMPQHSEQRNAAGTSSIYSAQPTQSQEEFKSDSSQTITEIFSSQPSLEDKPINPQGYHYNQAPANLMNYDSSRAPSSFRPQHLQFSNYEQLMETQKGQYPQSQQMQSWIQMIYSSLSSIKATCQPCSGVGDSAWIIQGFIFNLNQRPMYGQDFSNQSFGDGFQIPLNGINLDSVLSQLKEMLTNKVSKVVDSQVGQHLDKIDLELLDEETLFKLSTDSNPAVMFLYQEIEKTDKATEDLLSSYRSSFDKITQEWHTLQDEIYLYLYFSA